MYAHIICARKTSTLRTIHTCFIHAFHFLRPRAAAASIYFDVFLIGF